MGLEENKVVNEESNFLNQKQKELKAKIMIELMEAFFINIQKNQHILTDQALIDLVGTILIMFNREVIVHFIKSFKIIGSRKEFMKNIFSNIKDEVNRVIKNEMN